MKPADQGIDRFIYVYVYVSLPLCLFISLALDLSRVNRNFVGLIASAI